jgi:putative ABC transport system permease protein
MKDVHEAARRNTKEKRKSSRPFVRFVDDFRGNLLKPHIWLIKSIGVIVPRRLRADWRQEWEAELRSREALLADWRKLNWKNKLDLLRRSLGAFRDAWLLQPRRLEDEMFQDLRYGLRMLAKNPSFTLIAVITLALGVGANTAIFSIVRAVLIRPLPFAEPDRLMQASYRRGPGNPPDDTLSWIARRDLVDWRARSRSFERIGGYWNANLVLPTDGSPEFVRGVSVTYDLLPTLGVQPALGRYFLPEEGKPGGDRLIILSDELWRRRFGADPEIIGQTIRVVDGVYVVVGVMPPGFNFPLRQAREVLRFPSGQMGFWTLSDDDLSSGGRDRLYNAILRLKPGVAAEQAQTELETLFAQRVQDNPQEHDRNFTIGVRLVSLKDQTVGEAGVVLPILLGVIGMVILMVCANIANLLLARADGRRKEMAVRQSLGATRFRLVRQALTESLLLALAGGAAGTMLAAWLIRLFLKLSPHYIPRASESRIDTGTLLFTLAVTMIAGLLFGALPAWRAARVDLNETLKQTAGRAGSWRSSMRAPGNLLVTFEIALALTLALGAGLMLNSFARLMMVDPGLRTNGVTVAAIPSNVAFFRQVIERLEATPGVEAVASSNGLPLTTHGHGDYLMIEGRSRTAPNNPSAFARTHFVSSNYLDALGVHLLRGRFLAAGDTATTMPVAVINETAAQRFWNGEDPIGKRFSFSFGRPEGQGIWRQVVGIVKSTRHTGLDKEPGAEVYVPIEQQSWSQDMLFVRSSLPKADVARSIRQAVAAVDRNQAIFLITSMEDLLYDSVSTRRFTMLLLSGFSALALLLAMMGVYGVVSYTVAERTPEIGVRIALGAQGRDVLRMVLTQGLKPVIIGSAAGLIASLALGRVLSSLLYGVTATDPVTFAVVALLLSFAALLACWLPARRATKVDPMIALRSE